MKNMIKSSLLLIAVAIAVSCVDKSLDPLQIDKVKKGTILALRGTQLNNLYVKGIPGAEVFPKIADGTEKFVFDGEYLSEDPTSLASVDVYAVKGSGDRVLLVNVPFSSFKTDGTYPHPWVSISIDYKDILGKLGLDNTFNPNTSPQHLSDATVATLLSTYKFGINIECDLNLTDGSKILAADILAAGLFASNQFYPAMKLNYAQTDYCSYDKNSWGLSYDSQEAGACCNSLETNKFTQDLITDPTGNTYVMDNWWGDAVDATIVFSPSTNPSDQIVTVPTQTTSENGIAKGSGTYNQCLNTMTINCTYQFGTTIYAWVYTLTPQ